MMTLDIMTQKRSSQNKLKKIRHFYQNLDIKDEKLNKLKYRILYLVRKYEYEKYGGPLNKELYVVWGDYIVNKMNE